MVELPADAPAPPDGTEWVVATELQVGDELQAGAIGGQTEWFRIATLDPKPKTIWLKLVPTSTYLFGHMNMRPKRDEFVARRVKT